MHLDWPVLLGLACVGWTTREALRLLVSARRLRRVDSPRRGVRAESGVREPARAGIGTRPAAAGRRSGGRFAAWDEHGRRIVVEDPTAG